MKLDHRRTILVGLAFLSICAFWQMYDSVIPKILTETFRLNGTISGAIMALDNILALFLLPLFGHISDKCTHPRGRRTPFIVVGTLLAAVALVLCFAELNIGPRFGRFIESVSPLAFSVYLIHAHPLIWEHWLAGRFAFLADKPPILLASGVLGGAFAIYLVCSLADVLRAGLFRLFRVKAFSRWAEEAVSAQLRPQLEKE